jgi:hypothetical protein
VYDLPGVTEGERFGSQWEGLDSVAAEDLLRKLKGEVAAVALRVIAAVGIDEPTRGDRPMAGAERVARSRSVPGMRDVGERISPWARL